MQTILRSFTLFLFCNLPFVYYTTMRLTGKVPHFFVMFTDIALTGGMYYNILTYVPFLNGRVQYF
jgi:hypothetical protein